MKTLNKIKKGVLLFYNNMTFIEVCIILLIIITGPTSPVLALFVPAMIIDSVLTKIDINKKNK